MGTLVCSKCLDNEVMCKLKPCDGCSEVSDLRATNDPRMIGVYFARVLSDAV